MAKRRKLARVLVMSGHMGSLGKKSRKGKRSKKAVGAHVRKMPLSKTC